MVIRTLLTSFYSNNNQCASLIIIILYNNYHLLMSGNLSYNTIGSMGEPVLGDIQLVPSTISGYYQPLVYFTNGIQPPQWGSICYDSIVKADVKVICNQVGFELDDHSPFMGSEYVRCRIHVHTTLAVVN